MNEWSLESYITENTINMNEMNISDKYYSNLKFLKLFIN